VDNPTFTTIENIFSRIVEVEAPVRPIQVVIPLAGPAPEIWLHGPEQDAVAVPMFLADCAGRPTLEVLIIVIIVINIIITIIIIIIIIIIVIIIIIIIIIIITIITIILITILIITC
jgi:hypothetical protein